MRTDIENEISNIKNIDKEKEYNTKTTEMKNETKNVKQIYIICKLGTSQDPEVRHNAPRESLVNHQHEKYPVLVLLETKKKKKKKKKQRKKLLPHDLMLLGLQHSFSSNCVLQGMNLVDACFYLSFFSFCFYCVLFSSVLSFVCLYASINSL